THTHTHTHAPVHTHTRTKQQGPPVQTKVAWLISQASGTGCSCLCGAHADPRPEKQMVAAFMTSSVEAHESRPFRGEGSPFFNERKCVCVCGCVFECVCVCVYVSPRSMPRELASS